MTTSSGNTLRNIVTHSTFQIEELLNSASDDQALVLEDKNDCART